MGIIEVVGKYVILSCPNFSAEFIIHTDAIKTHLRVVIVQNGNLIDFYFFKFTPA